MLNPLLLKKMFSYQGMCVSEGNPLLTNNVSTHEMLHLRNCNSFTILLLVSRKLKMYFMVRKQAIN